MKVLVLAGGYGTRLYPVVKDIPKALLQVRDKPLIEYIVRKFKAVRDIDELVVVTNDKFFSLMSEWASRQEDAPFPVRVVNDGTRSPEGRLGAIGDILFVLNKENGLSDWLVAGSDNLFDSGVDDFIRFALSRAPSVTVGAYNIGDMSLASKFGVMELDHDGRVVSLEEKPQSPRSSLISMCLYFFPGPSVQLMRDFASEANGLDTTGGYIQWLYQKSRVYGFKFSGKWYDIGSLEAYHEAQANFLE
jgi:glucose-1-phosphate thymidylyltransferase